MAGGFIDGFMAGIYANGGDRLPLVPLGRWLLGIAAALLFAAYRLGRERRNRTFLMIRCGSQRQWWKRHLLKCLGGSFIFCAGAWLLLRLMDLLLKCNRYGALDNLIILALWTCHVLLLSALLCLLDLTSLRKGAPAGLIVFEVVTLILGFSVPPTAAFTFGTWGMYAQSCLQKAEYGVHPGLVLPAELLAIMGIYWLGLFFIKRGLLKNSGEIVKGDI